MAKRTDIKKVLIIGSGPIVIGQAAEFDYAGTQACLALKEEGYEVVLCNSNPATIMTDTTIADKVYMEPLTLEYIAKILRYERPDAIVPGIGGQTGLNIAMQLEKKGILKECGVELLGTSSESIERAEDRELFKELCQSIGEPVIPSEITYSIEEAKEAAKRIGYPVVLRPAFTLGGTGGGFAENEEELHEIGLNAFKLSPVHQVLIEKSVKGYKEIEFEVMRDSSDHAITICGMENIDPVGVHTGDSLVVAPIMTLSKEDEKMLNDSAIKLIKELKIEGGCNVQFALNPNSSEYYLIEVNPRVSRSSALASKASGYPIARVTAKIALGMLLEDIQIANTTAAFEPKLDYVIAKFPRFPFDKFTSAANTLGTQMKATGEVMGIGSNLEECLLKSARSLEINVNHLYMSKFDNMTKAELLDYISEFKDDNIFAIAELIARGATIDEIHEITKITSFFLESIKKIIDMEDTLKENVNDIETLIAAKKMGFSDKYIARLWKCEELDVYNKRKQNNIFPVFKMVDTCHTGAYIPYFYSSYTGENASRLTDKKKIVVLGAGPIRIGQGVEFDYSTVHAVQTIKASGYEAIIINNNPETVSTDYTTADKLYFEPLTPEDVMNIIEFEKPEGVIASLGGQTAINLAEPLMKRGVKIIGTDCAAIEKAENRDSFEKILHDLDIPQPKGKAVTKIEDGIAAAADIGYPFACAGGGDTLHESILCAVHQAFDISWSIFLTGKNCSCGVSDSSIDLYADVDAYHISFGNNDIRSAYTVNDHLIDRDTDISRIPAVSEKGAFAAGGTDDLSGNLIKIESRHTRTDFSCDAVTCRSGHFSRVTDADYLLRSMYVLPPRHNRSYPSSATMPSTILAASSSVTVMSRPAFS